MADLNNIGIDLGFTPKAIRRLIFCKTLNDSGSENVISLANAVAIANWQTQFNQYDHLDDSSDKFVCTPKVREVVQAETDAVIWEVEDYRIEMRSANIDLSFSLLDAAPYILGNLRALKTESISVFLISEDNKALGIKDGTDLKPFPIKDGSLIIPRPMIRGYNEGSKAVCSFRLDIGDDMDNMVCIEIADADVNSDIDFYSLRDCSATISEPAVTGCVFTPTVDDVDPEDPATTIGVLGITYDQITFTDQASPYTVVSLADAGSLSYSGNTITVNEAALLTTGHTYTVKVSKPKYNVVFSNDCIVP